MKDLIPPQININGTSRDALFREQVEVLRALEKVRQAMAEAMPHGRDYQFNPGEYAPARDAWMERLQMIYAMKEEIRQYAQAIQDDK